MKATSQSIKQLQSQEHLIKIALFFLFQMFKLSMRFSLSFFKFLVACIIASFCLFSSAVNAEIASAFDDQDPAKCGRTIGMIKTALADIQKKEESLPKGENLTEADKEDRANYKKVLEFDEKILMYSRVRVMFNNLHDLSRQSVEDVIVNSNLALLKNYKDRLNSDNIDELTKLQNKITAYKNDYSNYRETMMTHLDKSNRLPTLTQELAATYTDRSIEIKNDLSDLSNTSTSKQLALKAELTEMEQHLSFNDFLLDNSSDVYNFLRKRMDDYTSLADTCDEILTAIDMKISDIKNAEAKAQTEELQKKQSKMVAESPILKSISKKNLADLENRKNSIDETRALKSTNDKLVSMIDRIKNIDADIQNQIKYFDNSEFLAQILFNQNNIVPDVVIPGNLADKISDIRILNYKVNAELEQINNKDAYVQSIRKRIGFTDKLTDEQNKILDEQINLRRELLTGLHSQLALQLSSAVSIQTNAETYKKLRENLSNEITEAMFWSRSTSPIGKKWVKNLSETLEEQVYNNKNSFRGFSFSNFRISTALKGIPLLVIALLLLRFRSKIKEKIAKINKDIGSPRRDSHWNTIKSLGLVLLLCAPVPLLAWFLALMIHDLVVFNNDSSYLTDPEGSIRAVIAMVALLIFMSRFWLELRIKGGIAEVQFQIPYSAHAVFRRKIIFWIFGIMMALIVWKEREPQTFANDVFGQIFMIILPLILAFPFWKDLIARFRHNEGFLAKLESLFMTGASITVAVLSFLGYYYSSIIIAEKLIWTYYIILMYVIVDSTVIRALRLQSRRLAYQRKIEARIALKEKAKKEKGSDDKTDMDKIDEDDDQLPISEINTQSRSIVTYVLISIFAVIVYSVWSDTLTVVNYLQYINLYQLSSPDGSITKNVTMMDLLLVVYAIAITFVLIKNFAGVLEVFLFSRISRANKWSYTINTIFTYVAIAVCVMFCSARMGLSWDKLQWLVAALSVGLGFGLQEIFANFVSGIIILFERPIRIGDVITINGHSGIVSKIRIRATTITDFDKKDYVVPNKAFITTPIINWSLNEICLTRLVMSVGVGYGTDLVQAKEALLRVGHANKYVLNAPPCSVVFMEFGDSNLNLQLMVYIKKIQDYYPAIDSLNTEIYNELNRLGIEIAFNQLDVMIKNTHSGEEIKLDQKAMSQVLKASGNASVSQEKTEIEQALVRR